MLADLYINDQSQERVSGTASGRLLQHFHQRLPGYASTPLQELPALARCCRVGRLWVKDESSRLGLPAFKILGASWALYRALEARRGVAFSPWTTLDEWRSQLAPLGHLTLACATDGNHGRAVAWMARLLRYDARIFVPVTIAAARVEAIASEGAVVIPVNGSYEDAVALAAREASPDCLVISDAAWPGYEEVPRWVIEGYSTILWEVTDELTARGEPCVDLVVVQMGVGAFAAAVIQHYRRADSPPARILGIEPEDAACVLASLRRGQLTEVPGPHRSIMAGLNCGLPSLVAWPFLQRGLDVVLSVADDAARQAMRDLAASGVRAGETGAAGLAGLTALVTEGDERARHRLRLGLASRVLIFCTEGVTDTEAFSAIVGIQ